MEKISFEKIWKMEKKIDLIGVQSVTLVRNSTVAE